MFDTPATRWRHSKRRIWEPAGLTDLPGNTSGMDCLRSWRRDNALRVHKAHHRRPLTSREGFGGYSYATRQQQWAATCIGVRAGISDMEPPALLRVGCESEPSTPRDRAPQVQSLRGGHCRLRSHPRRFVTSSSAGRPGIANVF